MTSPDFWAILRALSARSDSAAATFEILENGTAGTPPAIMADNYEAAISLLNDFATYAGRAILAEQKGDPRPRKPRTSKRESSQNELVARGVKAITLIYDMTARIPHLMKQSHLESSEGKCPDARLSS
jgi:brefeldin A-resistance guanine nucleotide exchange factor 1